MLKLVQSRSVPPWNAACRVVLTLPVTAVVERFVEASATSGLAAADAVRLALERELLLADAGELGLGREAARHALTRFAAGARVRRPLTPALADYVRGLSVR